MNPRRFKMLLSAYGADWDRWPETERAAALRMLAESPDAQRLWQEARDLDAVLDRHADSPGDAALAQRLADAVLAQAAPPAPAPAPPVPLGRAMALRRWSQPLVGGVAVCLTVLVLVLTHPLGHLDGDPVEGDGAVFLAMSADGLEDLP